MFGVLRSGVGEQGVHRGQPRAAYRDTWRLLLGYVVDTTGTAAHAGRSTQTVTVHAVSAAGVAPAVGQLSRTGFEGMPLAVGGGVLVLTGAGAVLVARRRKSAQVPS